MPEHKSRSTGAVVALSFALLAAMPAMAHAIEFTVDPLGGSVVEGQQVGAGRIANVTIDVAGAASSAACQAPSARHTAVIDWDDGTVQPGTVTNARLGSPGTCQFFVQAPAHRYVLARPAAYQVRLTVADSAVPGSDVTRQRALLVTDAPVAGEGVPIAAAAGQPFTGAIGEIQDENEFSTADQFASTVSWGDGTAPTPATVAGDSSGRFTVLGSHTYAAPGTYAVVISTVHAGRTFVHDAGTATVSPAAAVVGPPVTPPPAVVGPLPPPPPGVTPSPSFRIVGGRPTAARLRSRGVRLRIGLGSFAGTSVRLAIRGTRPVRTLATVTLGLRRARVVDERDRVVEVVWRPSARLLRRLALRAGRSYGLRVRFPGSGTLQATLALRR